MDNNQAASENFFLSPILHSQEDHSPYLSPFHNPFRKQSGGFEDLIDFRLDDNQLESCGKMESLEEPIAEEDLILEGAHYSESVQQNGEESQEAASPNNSHHCEIPSTKFAFIKQESQPTFFLLRVEQEGESQVQAMIYFLIEHSHPKEDLLDPENNHFYENNLAMHQAFKILATKFRKLRKTKEEMTKYCMRKAFKFIADRTRKDKAHTRDLDNCMKQYFQGANGGNFSIPFKKQSTQKTMNGNFIKRIFGCSQFSQDYKIFLRDFQSLVTEDNERKVKYLAGMVQEALQKGDPESIHKIKRLPWTRQILKQVYDLAISLSDSPQQPFTRLSRRNSE